MFLFVALCLLRFLYVTFEALFFLDLFVSAEKKIVFTFLN